MGTVRHTSSRGLPVSLILAVSMVAAGIVYPVTDSALHHTSPIMIATLRALVGGAALTAMLPLMGSRLPRTRRLWLWALGIGFCNTTLTQVGISVGTDRAGAAVAAVLANSAPFFVAIIARFALGERITRLRAAGLVIGFGGVLLVVFADPGNIAHGSRLAIGLGLALLGALGWALGGLGMRVLTEREPDLDIAGITAAQFLAGGIPLIPLVLRRGREHRLGSASAAGAACLPHLRWAGAGLRRLQRCAEPLAVHACVCLDVSRPGSGSARRGGPGLAARDGATVGIVLVILGVAIVNLPRAEGTPVGGAVPPEAEAACPASS